MNPEQSPLYSILEYIRDMSNWTDPLVVLVVKEYERIVRDFSSSLLFYGISQTFVYLDLVVIGTDFKA